MFKIVKSTFLVSTLAAAYTQTTPETKNAEKVVVYVEYDGTALRPKYEVCGRLGHNIIAGITNTLGSYPATTIKEGYHWLAHQTGWKNSDMFSKLNDMLETYKKNHPEHIWKNNNSACYEL